MSVFAAQLPKVSLVVSVICFGLFQLSLAHAQTANPGISAQAQSANRQAGYQDGCATARSSNLVPKPKRDEAAFAASESYRDGWRQGYNTCQHGVENTPERLLGSPFGRR